MKKVLGFLVLSVVLIAVGFYLCECGFGEKLKALVEPTKTYFSEVVEEIKK